MTGKYVLAIDEGSSSARAVLFDADGRVAGDATRPIVAMYPHAGWVELDPAGLWTAVQEAVTEVMARVGVESDDLAAVGVTTHRETCIIWDRATGQPVHNAIMWMSKQTDDIVRRWSDSGLDDLIRERTGLRNDSFFTAAKAAWILETVPGARERAERGELALGTPETWLLWNLTGGRVHQTDPGCASRTAMFDIARGVWDEQLCDLFGVPMSMLAEVRPSNSWFGDVAAGVLPGRATRPVPIWAVLGDQQAGLFGQACLQPGDVKSTYGTAGVINVNIGQEPRMLDGLMTSIAWNIDGRIDYEVEGVVCHSGQTLHWLRDRLGIIDSLESTSALAAGVKDNGGVYFVPAFSGLWNPYWDRNVRGTIVGLTLETGREHVVRAAIESMAYQTRDVVDALVAGGVPVSSLRVDGGAASNEFLCQFQADILGVPVLRAHQLEQTAFGVAHLAGAGAGLWSSFDDVGARWRSDRIFEPALPEAQRAEVYEGWQLAVKAARSLPPRTTTHHTREELR